MIRSGYTTFQESWQSRAATMRADLEAEDYARLFFLAALSLCDAYDMHDYDRHEIVKGIIEGMKAHNYEAINDGISMLEALPE